eukprot:Opistho-2@14657
MSEVSQWLERTGLMTHTLKFRKLKTLAEVAALSDADLSGMGIADEAIRASIMSEVTALKNGDTGGSKVAATPPRAGTQSAAFRQRAASVGAAPSPVSKPFGATPPPVLPKSTAVRRLSSEGDAAGPPSPAAASHESTIPEEGHVPAADESSTARRSSVSSLAKAFANVPAVEKTPPTVLPRPRPLREGGAFAVGGASPAVDAQGADEGKKDAGAAVTPRRISLPATFNPMVMSPMGRPPLSKPPAAQEEEAVAEKATDAPEDVGDLSTIVKSRPRQENKRRPSRGSIRQSRLSMTAADQEAFDTLVATGTLPSESTQSTSTAIAAATVDAPNGDSIAISASAETSASSEKLSEANAGGDGVAVEDKIAVAE